MVTIGTLTTPPARQLARGGNTVEIGRPNFIESIRDSLERRGPDGAYVEAVVEGSAMRLRPKLMTVATTVLGLIPIMLSSGSGLDVTQPIAAPSVGGMVTSTIYVLFLIPCLFAIGNDLRTRRAAREPRRAS